MIGQKWYFIDGSEKPYGPVTTPQLQTYIATGNILPETPLWTESFGQQWIPAADLVNFFPDVITANHLTAPTINDIAVSNRRTAEPNTQPNNGLYPATIKKGGSAGLWCISLFGGLLTIMLGSLILGITPENLDTKASGAALYISLGIIGTGCVCVLFSLILPYIYIYRAWKCLQPGDATVSPGKSIGFLFIPLFNIYWFFKAIIGLPRQWNFITSTYMNTKYAPKLTIGALICMFLIPIIGHIIWLNQISKGLNFMVALNSQQSTSISKVIAEQRSYLNPK